MHPIPNTCSGRSAMRFIDSCPIRCPHAVFALLPPPSPPPAPLQLCPFRSPVLVCVPGCLVDHRPTIPTEPECPASARGRAYATGFRNVALVLLRISTVLCLRVCVFCPARPAGYRMIRAHSHSTQTHTPAFDIIRMATNDDDDGDDDTPRSG